MTQEWTSLKAPGAFLQSPLSDHKDLTLVGLVELWSITRRVFERFGADIETDFAKQRSVDIDGLNRQYDKWQQEWSDILIPAHRPEYIPQRIFDLYLHSAKLYLCSHVFRGPPVSDGLGYRCLFTQQAFDSALKIIGAAVEETDDRRWLEDLPPYFGTMIAFASVCIIRIPAIQGAIAPSKVNDSLQYPQRLAEILQRSSVTESRKHPLLSIARSLRTATTDTPPAQSMQAIDSIDRLLPDIDFDFDSFASDALNWNLPGLDDNWMLCPDDVDPAVL